MAELKTKRNEISVIDFINLIDDDIKKNDCIELINIFNEVTNYKAVMWGDSIIGFGSYHYKSDRSSQEGDWPLTWFSPRKLNNSIYIMSWFKNYQKILDKLWKFKVSKGSCLYIKKLSDINIDELKKLIKISIEDMKKNYVISE